MNRVPLLIACILLALAPAWFSLVRIAARQQSSLAPHTRGESIYPQDRVGQAKMGREAYRANGCYHCHSQQVQQGAVVYNLFLTGSGANREGLLSAMGRRVEAANATGNQVQTKSWSAARDAGALHTALFLNTDDFKTLDEARLAQRPEAGVALKLEASARLEALSLAALADKNEIARARRLLKLPQEENSTAPVKADKPGLFLAGPVGWTEARAAVAALKNAGGVVLMQPELAPVAQGQPVGDTVAHGGSTAWGQRRSVGRDYLFETPLMLGSQRIGPDLAHLGGRWKGDAWHYQHLYNPRAQGVGHPKSVMPPYRFLFTRRAGAKMSEAEMAQGGFVSGNEVVLPKPEARALVAYLRSLEQPDLLPEAPAPKSRAAVLRPNP